MELPRTETSTIYYQIESDLKDAMNVLPEATFAANGHRITKYVAAMTLTDVYMYQHKYAEAAETVRIVVNSNHKLTTNDDLAMNSAFNKLRSTDDLDEAIYAYEYDNQISPSNWLPTLLLMVTLLVTVCLEHMPSPRKYMDRMTVILIFMNQTIYVPVFCDTTCSK